VQVAILLDSSLFKCFEIALETSEPRGCIAVALPSATSCGTHTQCQELQNATLPDLLVGRHQTAASAGQGRAELGAKPEPLKPAAELRKVENMLRTFAAMEKG
jgi:hypothetical protein